jgi:hypothetical protein
MTVPMTCPHRGRPGDPCPECSEPTEPSVAIASEPVAAQSLNSVRSAHPEPHSMNGALWPDQPSSCDCECPRCWRAYEGHCLCEDCQDEWHDHTLRHHDQESL